MVEGGDIDKADRWIAQLRAEGFFDRGSSAQAMPHSSESSPRFGTDETDGGYFLRKSLKWELQADESGFKHRMSVLDYAVKGNLPGNMDMITGGLERLHEEKAGSFYPYSLVDCKYLWHGCKYSASVVLYLISGMDDLSKREFR